MVKNSACMQSAATAILTALACALAAAPAAAQANKEKVLYSYSGGSDGGYPEGPAIRVGDNYYGTTLTGGNDTCNAPYGCGTVYELAPHGKETVLYTFTGANGDGAFPDGPLIRDAQGNFYGTTAGGGDTNCQCGTVFELDSSGKETVLYAFTDSFTAQGPNSGVVRDKHGNLYGTNYTGGGGANGNDGTIFKIDAKGNYTVLHSFSCAVKDDGCFPWLAPMIMDAKGNLFGVTFFGGSAGGYGTAYEFDTSSNKLKVLYSFSGGADGGEPSGALLADGSGNFYGTTYSGGAAFGAGGNGVVYKLSKGVQTVLYTFPTNGGNGNYGSGGPYGAGLVTDKAGNLYGTQWGGGAAYQGSVFKVDPSGNETDLYDFTGGADGLAPAAPPILDAKGNLYGTTVAGGAKGNGAFFKLTP